MIPLPSLFPRFVLGLAAAIALTGAVASAAGADSISFTRGFDVWVANTDGSGQLQLTTDGGYNSTSQADDGTIVAQHGKQIARIDRQGNVALQDSITTKMPNAPVGGPWDPEISPDGSKLAYWVGAYGSYHDPTTGITFLSTGQFVIWADGHSGDITGMTNWHQTPSWVGDSSGALIWDPTATISPQVNYAQPNQSHNDIKPWFRDRLANGGDEVLRQVGQGEISRSGNRLVAVRSSTWVGSSQLHEGGNQIAVYDVVGGYDQPPVMRPCKIEGQGLAEVDDPQLSPDGNTVIWEEASGIWASDLSGGGCGTPHLLIEGGYRPDWGVAARGNGRPPVAPTTPIAPVVPVKPADRVKPKAVTASIAARLRARSLARGVPVTVTCPTACTAQVTVRDGRAALGTTRARLAAGTATTLRVRISARRRALLGRKGHRTLTAVVRVGSRKLTTKAPVRR